MAGHPERPSATDRAERIDEHNRYMRLATAGLLGYGEEDREQLQAEYDVLRAQQLNRAKEKGKADGFWAGGYLVACGGILGTMFADIAVKASELTSAAEMGAVGAAGLWLFFKGGNMHDKLAEGEEQLEWESSEAQARLLSVDWEDMRGRWPYAAEPESDQSQSAQLLEASILGGLAAGAATFVAQRALDRNGGPATYLAAGFAAATGAAAAIATLRNRQGA